MSHPPARRIRSTDPATPARTNVLAVRTARSRTEPCAAGEQEVALHEARQRVARCSHVREQDGADLRFSTSPRAPREDRAAGIGPPRFLPGGTLPAVRSAARTSAMGSRPVNAGIVALLITIGAAVTPAQTKTPAPFEADDPLLRDFQ